VKILDRVPFQHCEACSECGRVELEIVHDQKYPSTEGLDRLVIYRCPNGHETRTRQLIIKAERVPPKKLWEGY